MKRFIGLIIKKGPEGPFYVRHYDRDDNSCDPDFILNASFGIRTDAAKRRREERNRPAKNDFITKLSKK